MTPSRRSTLGRRRELLDAPVPTESVPGCLHPSWSTEGRQSRRSTADERDRLIAERLGAMVEQAGLQLGDDSDGRSEDQDEHHAD